MIRKICGFFQRKGYVNHDDENLMSPFDVVALNEVLSLFDRHDLNCLEIGSWFGAGSTQIIANFSKELVCIDHWQGNENESMKNTVRTIDVYKRFLENTEKFNGRVKPIKGSSQDICPLLEKERYDFIFIDGDHRYSSTVQDIKSTLPLLKPGGVLAGHDCEGRITRKTAKIIDENLDSDHIDSIYPDFLECHPGVIKAVDELIEKANLYAEKRFEIDNGVSGYSTIWWTRV